MLSKYQEKIKRRYRKTESGRIAYAIWENREKIYSGIYKDEEVDLGDGVKAFQEGTLALIICRDVPEKASRFWIKVLPSFEHNIDRLADILDAQPWQYF